MQWDSHALIGGHPTLDFVNTVSNQDKQRDQSCIADWESFLAWASQSKMFTDEPLTQLIQEADLGVQERSLNAIHKLREMEYSALSRLAKEGFQTSDALQTLAPKLKRAIGRAHWVSCETGCYWQADMTQAHWLEDTLLFSLEALLRSPELKKLKECGRCSWLFLDKGRGKGRRWCDMSTCGNRAKLESFRRRAH